MKITRLYTTADRPVADQIEWKTVEVRITGKDAQVPTVEVPVAWSQNAANILADKFLRKAGVPSETVHMFSLDPEREERLRPVGMPLWLWPSQSAVGASIGNETSGRQVFHRLAGHWTYVGWKEGYFTTEEDALAFYDETYWCLANQLAVPNSPQWFNSGIWWAYGIEGSDAGMWRVGPDGKPGLVSGVYEYPQPHACFLTPTADDLVNEGGIMDTWVREARIFKHGSGSGINASAWRGKDEKLSGGGSASGVMSWLRIGDSAAGAIQSGGTTRRAAKLVLLDDDHPDLQAFIDWKVNEEYKAAAMYVGSQLLRDYYLGNGDPEEDPTIDVPQQMIDRMREGFEPIILGKGFEEEANRTIDGQNSNNSVRVTDAFMAASESDADWHLKAKTTGEIVRTIKAKELWNRLVRAAWASADPGLIFDDTVNAWHTTPAGGPIRTSNPCCEFHSNDGNACNLASLNLVGFLLPDGSIDIKKYEHVLRLFTIILDISNSMASFPAREFAVGAYEYRTIGLGYMNLGALLMRLALPYDSDEGRALAAAMTALMTGVAYCTSAEIADELGPFPRWEENVSSFFSIMHKHREAVDHISRIGAAGIVITAAIESWESVLRARSFRNAQATLLAPTGTIHLVCDCDTSGIEPDYALVKDKKLAGGGSMKIVNRSVEPALARMGYDRLQIHNIQTSIASGQPLSMVQEHHRRVFDCVDELEPMAHVKMVAAVQPFLSGAASKTINLPHDATIEDVERMYREAHRLGIKAISVYRDGSKLAQPLSSAKSKAKPVTAVVSRRIPTGERPTDPVYARGEREPLPPRRPGMTQKARVGGQTVYLRTGEYEDGRLGEVFIDLAGAGSTLDGFANALAKMSSIAIQFGAPVSKVVDALLGVRFEPSGHVELHDRVRWCQSIPDLVARDIAIAYLGREDLAHTVHAVAVDDPEKIVALDRRAVAVAGGMITGETCRQPGCGGILRRRGTCMSCDDCGWNEGCG